MAIKILIITKDTKRIAEIIEHKDFNIDVIQDNINEKLIKEINQKYNEKYDYILVTDKISGCTFKNYVPLNYEEKYKNKIFVNERIISSIILQHLKFIVDNYEMIEVGILIKHIIINDIKKRDFKFKEIIKQIQKNNNVDDNSIKTYEDRIYHLIKKQYTNSNIIKTIIYKLNSDRIIKSFIYTLYDVIDKDIKINTNNKLVFKEFIGVIV